MSKNDNSPLPEFQTDDEARQFVDDGDLSQHDLRTGRRVVRLNFVEQPSATFEIYLDSAGEFRFRLRDTTGKILLVSEGYKNKVSAISVIEVLRIHVRDAELQEAAPLKAATAPIGFTRPGR